ncbi:hypothetical protein A3B42_03690 [Candidatus Daviesbacteria bacterium RIFCSPLOWO2_01_FULL_38_10]|uniref:Peptidase A2 domain-containing protein n=1 Tax=Candidatus Daviesbacteria bacterium GW2011_GWF2_38_6 TaxID=1618432 RepID=A0A0G0MXB4_9BACT|nr:MAG: hypothetical protein US99_C0026G0014 [Candidatus Daviesbacteria bacterium GW2011_GWF2_38_6]OGE26356.1 MAG: hypothetical protein A3D02_01650 [Candidatus Daviesbacteria bacterium RIFCSPHIGHO2_02_FULL_39_41]OGE27778.1 MAG: hypothetical protein A2772_01840 [Candidatus Daviesbacteria bacterium RIFCSPHIGHO2_01_FULL_38_8b]OGE39516.1 MAG: hypothetical protein A3B42_03690 [Candidatus Daviesbacteria bacterium RIFCSPLOWO2_01_FULL_38_10]OGE45097.1 MAG: hypothetical protein A3E67_04055 [Candidatus D
MIFAYIDDEPIVPLEIQTRNGEWIEFHAYIDSGAGFSVFHADHAEVLGLNMTKGRKIFFTVGDGAQIPAYIHKVPVKFAGERFMAEIAFSASLGVGTNLLGLKSFFDRFSFCFQHFLKKVEIKKG